MRPILFQIAIQVALSQVASGFILNSLQPALSSSASATHRARRSLATAAKKKRVRKRKDTGGSSGGDGSEAAFDEEVDALVRKRKVTKIFRDGPDLETFIVEESSDVELPSFEDTLAKKGGPSTPSAARPAPVQAAPEEEEPLVGEVLRGIQEALFPAESKNPKPSDDFFDMGLGLLVKRSVYACAAAAFLWEIYINSPMFGRKLPRPSIEEALVGYPIEKQATPSTQEGQNGPPPSVFPQ